DQAVGFFNDRGDLRIARRLRGDLEKQRRIHLIRTAAAPALDRIQDALYEIGRRLDLFELSTAGLELTFDDGSDDRVLVLEVAIHEAGAHACLLRDVRNACGVEAALQEAQARGLQDALALLERSFGEGVL